MGFAIQSKSSNFVASIINHIKMKRIQSLALLLVSLLVMAGISVSCGIGNHEDPEHPVIVSYTISAGTVSFEGPDQLLLDIQAWIKANQIFKDYQVNYSTGEASEFSSADAEVIKTYNEVFLPKFKSYLNDVTASLNKGTYGKDVNVKATFYAFASRIQGKGGDLKYEHIDYSYPTPSF